MGTKKRVKEVKVESSHEKKKMLFQAVMGWGKLDVFYLSPHWLSLSEQNDWQETSFYFCFVLLLLLFFSEDKKATKLGKNWWNVKQNTSYFPANLPFEDVNTDFIQKNKERQPSFFT